MTGEWFCDAYSYQIWHCIAFMNACQYCFITEFGVIACCGEFSDIINSGDAITALVIFAPAITEPI